MEMARQKRKVALPLFPLTVKNLTIFSSIAIHPLETHAPYNRSFSNFSFIFLSWSSRILALRHLLCNTCA